MYLYLLIVLGFFAFGDFLGVRTKAKVSSVFVALMLFLVCFLLGVLPPDIIDKAGLTQLSKMSTGFVVYNIGTSINLAEMRREWKIVVMSILSMGVAVISILVVSPIIGFQSSIVSIPIVNGGIVATQIMTEAALDKGFPIAAALGTVVFAVQKFVGTVPASRFGLKEAEVLAVRYRENLEKGVDLLEEEYTEKVENKEKVKESFCKKYDKYYTFYMCLGITAFSIYIATLLAQVTGVASSIWCLILGMTLSQFGLVPARILDKAKSSGLFMVATFCTLIPSLGKISISDVASLAFQTIVVFGAVLIGTFILLYFLPLWKIIGSRNLTIGVAMSQLLGFPATLLIVNEVATAVAKNDREKEYIVKKLTPAFVVSGFVSVTTISIFIAGIFANFI